MTAMRPTVRLTTPHLRRAAMAGLLAALCLAPGCATEGTGGGAQVGRDADPSGRWTVGTILDVRTQQRVSIETWLRDLASADVIYVGEEHHNREHIAAALRILQSLLDRGRRPVLGMEMFSWDGQSGLDHGMRKPSPPTAEFLDSVKWTQNWGGAYEDYEPLTRFAADHGLRLRALNAPRPLVRKVVKLGLKDALELEESTQWGMGVNDIVDDRPYRDMIIGQLKACHGGGEERDYQTMYEASLFRDESMAKTVAEEIQTIRTKNDPSAGPMVSYTGSGHIQYRLPMPNRVARRVGEGVKQVTIYLASFEPSRTEELHEWLDRKIGDFIWLTPLGAGGAPRRCK